MKKIILVLILMILLSGCGNNSSMKIENKEETKKIDTISKYDEIISKNNYIVVDVRTKEEYDESHVIGSINIPYDQINEQTTLDKTKTIMVYCKSGIRSNKAYSTLKSLGFDVYDLGAFSNVKLPKE